MSKTTVVEWLGDNVDDNNYDLCGKLFGKHVDIYEVDGKWCVLYNMALIQRCPTKSHAKVFAEGINTLEELTNLLVESVKGYV